MKPFFTALSQLFLCNYYDELIFPGDGELTSIPEKDKCKSYILDFSGGGRVVPDSTHGAMKSIRGKDISGDVPLIFGTPSIIVRCGINEAKGNVCVSLRAILQNTYECHRVSHHDNKISSPSITILWNLHATQPCVCLLTPKMTSSKLVVSFVTRMRSALM